MMVEHESSNLSETKNMVSYIIDTTTPKTPLYETTQQAEGKHYSLQSPSACILVVNNRLRTIDECSSVKAEVIGANPTEHIPATFDPFGLPDPGAGKLNRHHTTKARAVTNFPTKRKGQIGKPAGLESGDDRLRSPFLSYSVTLLELL